jgi:hypothetical protein
MSLPLRRSPRTVIEVERQQGRQTEVLGCPNYSCLGEAQMMRRH